MNNTKREFNVDSKIDLQRYNEFLSNRGWKLPCPFILEEPYISIPTMIIDKIVHKYINTNG